MKIHLHKEQTAEKTSLTQLIGFKKPTPCYEIYAWFELSPEEAAIVQRSPGFKDQKLFTYRYEGLDLSPDVERMINQPKPGEKGLRFVAYDSGSFFELEEQIMNGAKALKSHLEGLRDSNGSSTIEL